jgi:hypothetical protein
VSSPPLNCPEAPPATGGRQPREGSADEGAQPAVLAATALPQEDVLREADGEELIMHLEPDQLVVETFRPVERAHLSSAARTALWTLRIFALVVSLMVLYAFIVNLH